MRNDFWSTSLSPVPVAVYLNKGRYCYSVCECNLLFYFEEIRKSGMPVLDRCLDMSK
jgi:hypothetical protein